MANWWGDYQSDTGKVFLRTILPVGWVEVTRGEIAGSFSLSSEDDDSRYLPRLWFENTNIPQRREAFCPFPHTPRYALLWVTEAIYLRVPLPWMPGSTLYNQFFITLAFDFDSKLLTVGQRGEQISSNWLKLYLR
jgi:hypothetical protein